MGGYVGSSRAVTLTTTSVDVEGDIDLTGDIKILTSSGGTYTITGADTSTNKTIDVNSLTPSGVVVPYAGINSPDGWIICDGRSLATADYPSLYSAIGYTYGGSGSNFNIPDLRGRVAAGKNNMGTQGDANLITTSGAGFNGDNLGATGGSQTHRLQEDESGLVGHTHSDSFGVRRVSGTDNNEPHTGFSTGTGTSISTYTAGIGGAVTAVSGAQAAQAHNNVQPTIILYYIIKE